VLAYNLMMFAIVAVCLAAIHLAFEERQRRQVSLLQLMICVLEHDFWAHRVDARLAIDQLRDIQIHSHA